MFEYLILFQAFNQNLLTLRWENWKCKKADWFQGLQHYIALLVLKYLILDELKYQRNLHKWHIFTCECKNAEYGIQ